MSEVTIWTGQPGSGKSTILQQVLNNLMEQGVNCLIYTPELSNEQMKEWTCRQLLNETKGSFNKYYCDVIQEEEFIIKKEISKKMTKWIDNHLTNITNRKNLTDKEVLRLLVRLIKKKDIKFIVIDNLMKIIFTSEKGFLIQQKEFINSLSEIAKKYNVNINLVAHPKKHDKTQPDQYDIAGTADIPNLVDSIYYFRRITDWCIANDFKSNSDDIYEKDFSTAMMVLKSRFGKKIGTWVFYSFDVVRKLLFDPDVERKYFKKWITYDDLDNEIPEF